MNPLDHPKGASGDFEIPIAFHCDASLVRPDFLPFGDDSTHQVARLEALHAAWTFGVTARKTKGIHIGHLTPLAARRFDDPGTNMF